MDNPGDNKTPESVAICNDPWHHAPVPSDYDLSPADAAEVLGVHVETLKRWARDGKVRAWKTPGGWWRFRRADLDALLPEPERVA